MLLLWLWSVTLDIEYLNRKSYPKEYGYENWEDLTTVVHLFSICMFRVMKTFKRSSIHSYNRSSDDWDHNDNTKIFPPKCFLWLSKSKLTRWLMMPLMILQLVFTPPSSRVDRSEGCPWIRWKAIPANALDRSCMVMVTEPPAERAWRIIVV